MTVDVVVPPVGDSISEVMIGEWRKKVGDLVALDEPLVELESEKSTFDVPSPAAGVLTKVALATGDTAAIGAVLAVIDPAAVPAASTTAAPSGASPAATKSPAGSAAASTPAAAATGHVMPAAARVLAEGNVPSAAVTGSGPGGRVLKEDAQRAVANKATSAMPAATASPAGTSSPGSSSPAATVPAVPAKPQQVLSASAPAVRVAGDRSIRRQTMSPIRRTIAHRLVEAQQTAALLTTFNECDMSAVMQLRKQHQDAFTEKYGTKLGFMSFFVKAAIDALQAFPAINAQIQGNEIVFYDYCDIGIAIGGGKGLIVPVLRNAEQMSFAQIELAILDFAKRSQNGQLGPDELKGGTFTISNGGVYGSLLSTPIVNPPQSGVLGMHATQDRPVVRDGQIVIRPMMYLALTYDHRVVDGREAVSFLKRIKDCIENPVRLLLDV
jgi:2-oxoglutarate dehydrogenase E2 component (dihydrolipoamide succinyltransferase)